jgi:hypothetical protein
MDSFTLSGILLVAPFLPAPDQPWIEGLGAESMGVHRYIDNARGWEPLACEFRWFASRFITDLGKD